MPRKHFRKYLPDPDKLRSTPVFAWCGDWLSHPNLWHLNRDSVAGGVAIGLFAGLVPGPLQIITALALAIPLRRNLPVAVIATFYTNPITIVPLYLLAYQFGSLLLGLNHHPPAVEPFVMDWGNLFASLEDLARWCLALGKPLLVGLVALACSLAALGFVAVQVGWRVYIRQAWRARQRRRARGA